MQQNTIHLRRRNFVWCVVEGDVNTGLAKKLKKIVGGTLNS